MGAGQPNRLVSVELALADASSALALSMNNAHILDTRGYAYLKAKNYASAKADYEELLRREFTVPHVLLGAGIAYAQLGASAQALPLLEEGLEAARLERRPDPQLADLMAIAEAAVRLLR
jgi:tetratricopeptide (TPR) repeat protein